MELTLIIELIIAAVYGCYWLNKKTNETNEQIIDLYTQIAELNLLIEDLKPTEVKNKIGFKK